MLDEACRASPAFVRIRPPQDGLYWKLRLDLSSERGRAVFKRFCSVCDTTELGRMPREIVFSPGRDSGATLSLKERETVMMREPADDGFDSAKCHVVAETLRRMSPALFPE